MNMTIIPYDDRDGLIWLDGQAMPWRDAKVHFLTHALHYGSSVFEGIRSYNGKIFKLKEHAERLIESCRIMDMKIDFTAQDVENACLETLRINNLAEAYIRPLAWRGAQQMGVSAQLTKTHLGVAAWAWPNYFTPEMREKGISLKTSPWRRPHPETAPICAKAAGLYMICTLSKHAAEKDGFNDALMLDYRGHVAELTGANFFMIKNGALHTPTPDCFLNGITRQTVIQIANENGLKVLEHTIMPEDLASADECFATGTAAEVTAIGRIDDNVYPVGPVTRMIRDKYEQLVRA